jgi:hypothetical protein
MSRPVSGRSAYLDSKIRKVENDNVVPFGKAFARRTVPDPYTGTPQSLVANVRGDLVGNMQSRRVIQHEHHYQVARYLEQTYERGEVGGVKAMNPLKEPVDGGGARGEHYNDRTRNAYAILARAKQVLGPDAYRLVEIVIRERRSLKEVAVMTGHDYENVRGRFRSALDKLAKAFGFIGEGPHRKRMNDRHSRAEGERTNIIKLAA